MPVFDAASMECQFAFFVTGCYANEIVDNIVLYVRRWCWSTSEADDNVVEFCTRHAASIQYIEFSKAFVQFGNDVFQARGSFCIRDASHTRSVTVIRHVLDPNNAPVISNFDNRIHLVWDLSCR